MSSEEATRKKASFGTRLGGTAFLMPAVIFLWVMVWTAFVDGPETLASRVARLMAVETGTSFQPLHSWLWVGCLLFLMPLSSLYYLIRAVTSHSDQLRICVYGFIHYVLIYLTWGSHGADIFGFVMLCTSSVWLTGVLIYDVRRLWLRRTQIGSRAAP